MPDRELVITRPEEGMYIYYDKSHIGHWVLRLHKTVPFVMYDYIKDITTLDEAQNKPWDRWDMSRVEYTTREWEIFVDRGTIVRILNPDIYTPTWEV